MVVIVVVCAFFFGRFCFGGGGGPVVVCVCVCPRTILKRHAFKRDWSICSSNDSHHRLNNQHDRGTYVTM